MKIRDLPEKWSDESGAEAEMRDYTIRLSTHDIARLRALSELYPHLEEGKLTTDLLSSALNELAASFPYKTGERVVAEDEFGDPFYEDAGVTPKFIELTRKHLEQLRRQSN